MFGVIGEETTVHGIAVSFKKAAKLWLLGSTWIVSFCSLVFDFRTQNIGSHAIIWKYYLMVFIDINAFLVNRLMRFKSIQVCRGIIMNLLSRISLFHNPLISDHALGKESEVSDRQSFPSVLYKKRVFVVLAIMFVGFGLISFRLIQYQISYDKMYYRLNPSPPEKDSKYRVYVPKDLEDCFVELKKMLPSKLMKKIKSREEFNIAEYHHGLGTWIRNSWGLWGGSRLRDYFQNIGIHHPDDMSSIILLSFHRHLNDEEIRLSKQVKFYQKYWEIIPKIFEKRKKEKIFKEDKLEYKEVEIDVNDLVRDLSSEMNTE